MAYEKPKVLFTREELENQGYNPDNHPAYIGTVMKRVAAERQAERDNETARRAARLEAQGMSPEARRDGVAIGEAALQSAFDPHSNRPISDQH